jgi:small multidrug resistance pump
MNSILMILLLTAVSAVGDYFLKLAGVGPKFIEMKWFAIGAAIYMSTIFGWFYVMKYVKLSSIGVIYSIASVLLFVALGIIFFHEKLNVYEIIGIITAIVSLILLGRFA